MNHPLILFDGVCNLCNRSVQFVIRHDKKKQFHFASLQGAAGQQLLHKHGLPVNMLNSFVLINENRVYTQSSAAIEMMRLLGGGWKYFSFLRVIPRFIRDAVYRWVARNRYKWFGKREECIIPSPDLRDRFLD